MDRVSHSLGETIAEYYTKLLGGAINQSMPSIRYVMPYSLFNTNRLLKPYFLSSHNFFPKLDNVTLNFTQPYFLCGWKQSITLHLFKWLSFSFIFIGFWGAWNVYAGYVLFHKCNDSFDQSFGWQPWPLGKVFPTAKYNNTLVNERQVRRKRETKEIFMYQVI